MNRQTLTRLALLSALSGAVLLLGYGVLKLVHRPAPVVQAVAPLPPPVVTRALVAAKPIARGERIAAADLASLPLSGPAPADLLVKPEATVGRTALADLAPGQLLLNTQLATDPNAAGLAAVIPPGQRGFEIRTNDEIAVGPFLRPGDHVDVALLLGRGVAGPAEANAPDPSESHILLQDVTVVAVNEQLGALPDKDAAARHAADPVPHMVTLALSPADVTRLVLARTLGSFYLALRNPTDHVPVTALASRFDSIRATQPPTLAMAEGRRPIELVVAGASRIIYSRDSLASPSLAASGSPAAASAEAPR